MPGAAAPCSASATVGLAAAEGAAVAVEAIVCAGVVEADAAGLGVACGVIRGAGVALGISKRPRRCDAVGEGDGNDTGGELAAGVGDCPKGVALRGVIFGSGVDVAAADGACVADMLAAGIGVIATGVDEADVSEP